MVPSQRLFVASSDFDPLGPKTLSEMHKPNLVIFDLTKNQWDELKTAFSLQTGNLIAAKELDSEEMRSSLQGALEDKPESTNSTESP
eukprot:symbB.v1.2.007290.t1/scaffold443.1/size206750/3